MSNPSDLALWQALAAQQIVPWPIEDLSLTPIHELQVLDIEGQSKHITIYENDRLIAMATDDTHCAYLLPRDSLSTLLTSRVE